MLTLEPRQIPLGTDLFEPGESFQLVPICNGSRVTEWFSISDYPVDVVKSYFLDGLTVRLTSYASHKPWVASVTDYGFMTALEPGTSDVVLSLTTIQLTRSGLCVAKQVGTQPLQPGITVDCAPPAVWGGQTCQRPTDLALIADPQPYHASAIGTDAGFLFFLSNESLEPADDVSVHISFSGPVSFNGAWFVLNDGNGTLDPDGHCAEVAAGQVACDLGRLRPGDYVNVSGSVVGAQPERATAHALLSSSTPDSDDSNDESTAGWQFVCPAPETPIWNGASCEACPPDAPVWDGIDCVSCEEIDGPDERCVVEALSFGGTDRWVDLGNSPRFNLSTPTIEAWIYLRSQPSTRVWLSVFNKWVNATEDKWITTGFFTAGAPDFGFWKGTASDPYIHAASSAPLAIGQWHHLAGVYDGTTARFYVNGALVATDGDTGSIAHAHGRAYIGANPQRGLAGIDGFIGELRISSAPKYAADFEPARQLQVEVDTVGLWRLDQGEVPFIEDVSGNGLQGTLSPGATWAQVPARN